MDCQNYSHDVDDIFLPNDPDCSIRVFESGASRDTDEGKLDFHGFLSHDVLVSYANYMHENRLLPNGELRDSDNWKKGIPKKQYIKSMFRHFMDVWANADNEDASLSEKEVCLNALLFNVMGLLHEELKSRKNALKHPDIGTNRCSSELLIY